MTTECPTCGAPMGPGTDRMPGVSRADNETEVCGPCTSLEALLDEAQANGRSWRGAMRTWWVMRTATAEALAEYNRGRS